MLCAFRFLLRIVSNLIVAVFIAGVLVVIVWRERTGRGNSRTQERRERE
jgi:hypothetical protein